MSYKGLELSELDSEIVGVLNCLIANNSITKYVEPYIGFGDVLGNIQCESKVGLDSNKYTISLFKYLIGGGELPEHLSLGNFEDVKAHYQCKSKVYEEWYYGLLGFTLSGSDESKPFNSRYITQGALDDAYSKLTDSIESHISNLDNTEFTVGEIADIPDDLENALVYCKIPKYKRFNAEKFLSKIFTLSKKNMVVLKTESVYEEFELLWEENWTVKPLGKQPVKLYRVIANS